MKLNSKTLLTSFFSLFLILCTAICVEAIPASKLQELIDSHKGKFLRVSNEVYDGDILIDTLSNTTIFFENVTIRGNLTLMKLMKSQILGRLIVRGDLNIIGCMYSKFENIETNFLYLQNFAGWGGFYWNTFDGLICQAMQVRQAKLTNGLSAINENYFNGLYVRGGLEKNNWNNLWIRSGVSGGGLEHTRLGTIDAENRWEATYTNPFVIEHFDFSDTNGKDVQSAGIIHEGPRPIVLRSGFIEHHHVAYRGNIIAQNVEIRSCKILPALSGIYDFDVSQTVGKVGNFKSQTAEGIIGNCEFKNGLSGFSGKDIEVLAFNNNSNENINQSNSYLKLVKRTDYSALVFEYLSNRTIPISIVVRGQNVGSIRHQSGGHNKQYGLGHQSTGQADEYYVARSYAFAGEPQAIWIMPGSSPETIVTGFQIYEGIVGYKMRQD